MATGGVESGEQSVSGSVYKVQVVTSFFQESGARISQDNEEKQVPSILLTSQK